MKKLQALIDTLLLFDPVTQDNFAINEAICEVLGWEPYNAVECEWKSPEGLISQPPHYTTSLDAALTLVPCEWDWIIGSINGQIGGTPYATVGDITAFGETPTTSLCLAALKARLVVKQRVMVTPKSSPVSSKEI